MRTRSAVRAARGVCERRDAEVRDLHAAVRRHEYVAGLEVEVQHAVVVCERERRDERLHDGCGLVERERLAGVVEDVRKRRALDGLHDDERLVGVGVPLVDGDDGRVVEHRGGACLGKTGLRERAAGAVHRKGQALDGHAARHLGVEGEHDVAVAAAAEVGQRAIAIEDERLFHGRPSSPVRRDCSA